VTTADHDDVVVGRVVHRTDLGARKVTKQGAMVTPSAACPPPLHSMACFLLDKICTFTGRRSAATHAEIGRTGVRSRTRKGSMTAPFGVPSPFVESQKTRPRDLVAAGSCAVRSGARRVSGTGGIQDDRIAEHQKPEMSAAKASLLARSAGRYSPRTREHEVTKKGFCVPPQQQLTWRVRCVMEDTIGICDTRHKWHARCIVVLTKPLRVASWASISNGYIRITTC
jgi:hypothetical protein